LFCTPEIARKYAHLHWQTLDGPTVTRVDEFGWERPLPKKNVTMYFPLARNDFPRGDIHLLGNDW
jgi:hypothetical protein